MNEINQNQRVEVNIISGENVKENINKIDIVPDSSKNLESEYLTKDKGNFGSSETRDSKTEVSVKDHHKIKTDETNSSITPIYKEKKEKGMPHQIELIKRKIKRSRIMKVMEAQTKKMVQYRTKFFLTKEQVQLKIFSYCKFNIVRQCVIPKK